MSLLRSYLAAQRGQLNYWGKRLRLRSSMPRLAPQDVAIVAGLRSEGGVVTSLEELALAGTAEMLDAADQLAAAMLGRRPGKGGFNIQASAAELDAQPAIIRWGLDERLLAIVGRYLGLPVAYRGVVLRRDIAGGTATETRLWHRDDEDHRIVKIIVYLNDVGEDGGPFEFVPKSAAPPLWRLPAGYGRIDDDAMADWAPEPTWRACTGERGTAVFTDTCGVLHRGRIATSGDRLALFFCYNSVEPVHPEYCGPLFDRARLRAATPGLSKLQEAAIAA